MGVQMTQAQLRRLQGSRLRGMAGLTPAKAKYGNKKVQAFDVDGAVITFDSKREAKRWSVLLLRQKAGEICSLDRQITYRFAIDDNYLTYKSNRVVRYVADFRYQMVESGEWVVEDVKSEPTKTPDYKIKWALMLLFHGIFVKEVS